MVRKNNIFFKIVIVLSFLLVSFSLFNIRVHADEENKVYFKESSYDADNGGLIKATLIAEGIPKAKVSVKYHTVGVTAITGIDFNAVSNTIDLEIGESGTVSYDVAIKCLNTAENRAKLKVTSKNVTYGRYFNLIIDSATNATIVEEKKECKCYLPYGYLVTANAEKYDDNGINVSYLEDLNNVEYRWTEGSTTIEKGHPWKTWEAGVTFVNETTERWVNAFINEGIASAYASFVIKDIDDTEFQSTDKIYTFAGNKEFMEKFNDSSDDPGLYLFLSTEPCSNKVSLFSSKRRGYELDLKAMNYIAEGKNPYDEDDDYVDVKKTTFYSEKKKIYWFNATTDGGTWYADGGDFINTTFYKTEPYNGVLDIGMAIRNNDGDQDRQAKRIWQFLKLVDDKAPEIVSEYVDDSELGSRGVLKFYIRFNEPVFSSKVNKYGGSTLQVQFNEGSSYFYPEYVAGNYTDTLLYELPANEVPKINIKSIAYQLPNDDIGDMAINRDSRKTIVNNKIPFEVTNVTRKSMSFINGPISMVTPQLAIDDPSSNSPKNIYNLLLSINDNGERDVFNGTVYYSWSLEESIADYSNPSSYDKERTLSSEESGSFALTLVKNEAEGLASGKYYLHALVVTPYGLTDYDTFGPYLLDGDPPVVEQQIPSINTLKTKEFEIDIKDKNSGTEIDSITLIAKYADKENRIEIYKDGVILDSVKKFVRTERDDENKITKYFYKANIDPAILDIGGDPLIDPKIIEFMGEEARVNFDISFEVTDVAGNKVLTPSIRATFDSRDMFKTTFGIPLATELEPDGYTLIEDISVSYKAYDRKSVVDNKNIVIEILDETEGGTKEGSNYRELLVDGTNFSVLVNGKEYSADGTEGDARYRVTLTDLGTGFFEIIPKIYGVSTLDESEVDVVAASILFYITNNKNDQTENYKIANGNLVLSNKVFQLTDTRYYYLDASGSNVQSFLYGATYNEDLAKFEGGSSTPSFSNVNEAKKYIKFMEYQDLYLIKVTPQIVNLLNGSSSGTNYVKAPGETVTAQDGQLWIRYKKNTWANTSTAYGWAYYYYGNGKVEDGINVNNLSANLNNAINEVVNRIVSAGSTVFLVEEEQLDHITRAPYLNAIDMHIVTESKSASILGSTYVEPVTYAGDKDLYKNNVKIGENYYPIATNMPIHVTLGTRLFYKYAGAGDWQELVTTDGTLLSKAFADLASGIYLFREYDDNGISEFSVYFDIDLPKLQVVVGDVENVLDGQILAFSSNSFTIKSLGTNESVEYDDYAYVAIYQYSGNKLLNVLYKEDIKNEQVSGYVLKDGNYYVQVGDRSGNVVVYKVLLATSSMEVKADVNESQTGLVVKVLNRDETEIYSYEVYLNEELISTEFAESTVFKKPGMYRIVVSDIYDNTITKMAEFQFQAPQINWYYLTDDETFAKYSPDRISKMIIMEDKNSSRVSNVYTASILKMTFITKYGDDNIKFEMLDIKPDEYSYQQASDTITIQTLTGFRLHVWYEKYPEYDHTYVVKVDTSGPSICASFIGTSFSGFYETDENGNLIQTGTFDVVDLKNHNDGDYVNLDTLRYVVGETAQIDFYDGNIINGGHIVLAFNDATGYLSHTVTRNGQPVELELNLNNELIIYGTGEYVVTVTDKLSNVSRIRFVNTDAGLTNTTVDDVNVSENKQLYGHNDIKMNYLYAGENRILIKGASGVYTYQINFDGTRVTYGRYVCETEKVEDKDTHEIVEQKKATFVENDGFIYNINNESIREGVWTPFITEKNHIISISILDKKPIIKVEPVEEKIDVEMTFSVGNNALPSYFIVSLSKEKPTVTIMSGEEEAIIKEDSDYIYIADDLSIKDSIDPNITKIEWGYSNTPEANKLEIVYYDGHFIKEAIGSEDGFYTIVVTNIYNNQTKYMVVKVASFKAIVNVTYRDGSERQFLTNENIIYSNSQITLDVYSDSVSFEVNQEAIGGTYNAGVTSISLDKPGDYAVRVISANGITENFGFAIGTDTQFVYQEEWVTGYNEEALLRSQGYTNTLLTVNPGENVLYVEYKLDDKDVVVLYDKLSDEKIEEELNESIGKDGNGTYLITFRNRYGDIATKAIYFNNKARLELSRKTVDNQSAFEKYDLQKAIDSNFYSNYILRFSTNSLRYEFTIDGNSVSLEEPKTIEFSNISGNGSFGYDITYRDEYGNYVEFKAELYRTDVMIDTSSMNALLIDNDIYTKDNISITFDDNLQGYVRVNGGDYKEYISGSKFYKDGKYDFIVEDIAGNRKKYSITHKSVNKYVLIDTQTDQQIIIGGVVNDSSVMFQALDDSKIKSVFKNGKRVDEYNSNTFITTGHWEILIEDSIGNQAYAGFYVINNALVNFDYQAPFDYQISEVWYTDRDGNRELLDMYGSSISLTDNGDYAIVVVGKEAVSSFNFAVTIDDSIPPVTLEGATNGGQTARNVTLKGLKSGDTVEIYKNGQLVSTTNVTLSDTPPEITTGGDYKIIVTSVSGAQVEFNFTRKKIANAATSIFIIITCLVAVVGVGIGLVYHTKLKTDSDK